MASDVQNKLASKAAKYNEIIQKQIDEAMDSFGQDQQKNIKRAAAFAL